MNKAARIHLLNITGFGPYTAIMNGRGDRYRRYALSTSEGVLRGLFDMAASAANAHGYGAGVRVLKDAALQNNLELTVTGTVRLIRLDGQYLVEGVVRRALKGEPRIRVIK